MRLALIAVAVMMVFTACNPFKGSAEASPSGSPVTSPLSPASGGLDAQVAMPSGFPSDVPIYPGARLTAGAAFSSNGVVSWGMEWETLDALARVHSFYAGKFAQGDWMIAFTADSSTGFTAAIARKSNPQAKGVVGADSSSGITKISLYLAQPGS